MVRITRIILAFVCCCVFLLRADESLNNESKLEIIDSISIALMGSYIFPDVAEEMETYLRNQYAEKAYQEIKSVAALADRLTKDLRSVSNDAHLKIEYHSDEYFTASETETMTDEQQKEWYDDQAYENFGFTKVEHLLGNVGYVQMNGFYEVERAGPTAIAAMTFLAYCDAIIFDLRANTGGWPSMIQLLASFFFDQPVQLSSFYIRKADQEIEFWTQPSESGPRMSDVKLYILTSRKTLSAAEAFAYDLKHLGRATIIGETTAGAAHPTEEHRFPDLNITVSVPYGRPISPITGTNWEGTGVEPHMQVPAEDALDVAHVEALKALIYETKNEEYKANLQSVIRDIDTR